MKKLIAIALLLMTGCSSEGERFGPMPSDIAPLFSGGGGNSVPAQAPAQPNIPATALAIEQHGVVNQSDCTRMLESFRRAGRQMRLVNVRRNDLGIGGVLNYICEFQEETPGQADDSYFQDNRYNNPSEYHE